MVMLKTFQIIERSLLSDMPAKLSQAIKSDIGFYRIMLDYGNPCFFCQKNVSVRISAQEYSQKTIRGLIHPMRSYKTR